jgi:AhpD family alkylhydroperoxidase
MARISLLDDLSGVPSNVLEPLLKRRGGKLLKVDKLLLHSPPFAVGWIGLVRAVIGEFGLEPRLSQLIMTAIAVLNDCEYELVAHGTSFLAAGGSKDQLAAMRQSVSAPTNELSLLLQSR